MGGAHRPAAYRAGEVKRLVAIRRGGVKPSTHRLRVIHRSTHAGPSASDRTPRHGGGLLRQNKIAGAGAQALRRGQISLGFVRWDGAGRKSISETMIQRPVLLPCPPNASWPRRVCRRNCAVSTILFTRRLPHFYGLNAAWTPTSAAHRHEGAPVTDRRRPAGRSSAPGIAPAIQDLCLACGTGALTTESGRRRVRSSIARPSGRRRRSRHRERRLDGTGEG